MTGHHPPPAHALSAVVFDVHSTLLHGGDASGWVEAGWRRTGAVGTATAGLGPTREGLVAFLDRVWEHAAVLDPASTRDLSPDDHRRVWDETVAQVPGVGRELADALYDVMTDHWTAYEDTLPTLAALRERGVAVAALSNIGFDLGPVLARTGIAEHLDAVVMSWEVGAVKPHGSLFAAALERLGVTAAQTLMVGDSWEHDGGAAALGIRTLLLPRTPPPVHGLELVLRLVG